jgi:hypothetical protein
MIFARAAQHKTLTAGRQEGVEQLFFRASGDETAAELAQNRSVKARIGQLQAQQVLLIDAAADSIGRQLISEVLGELKQAHQRQSPRGFSRLSAWGEEGRELGVAEDHPKVITQAQIGTAMRERSTGTPSVAAGTRVCLTLDLRGDRVLLAVAEIGCRKILQLQRSSA